MNLLERYLQGDTVQVYEEIERMGQNAFERNNLPEVKAVLTETMNRVAYNLDVIYVALVDEKYCFKKLPGMISNSPFSSPDGEPSFAFVD